MTQFQHGVAHGNAGAPRLTSQAIRAACAAESIVGADTVETLLRLRYPADQVDAARAEIQATYRELRGGPAPKTTPTLAQTPVDEFLADRTKLHQVAKALSRELGIDYVAAVERLARAAEKARTKTLAAGKQPITLHRALSDAGISVSLDAIERDVKHREEKAAREAPTPRPPGSTDAHGNVLFDANVDLDALLADDVAPMRAFRKARDMGLIAGSDGDRDRARAAFAETWRLHTDQGIDYVGTLQLRQHEREVRRLVEEYERRADQAAKLAREDRIRDAEREAEAAAERARRLRSRRTSDIRF